ncbi:MAG: MGMT family protein [Opitutaceae bacterium]|nr:MGMT family protein [Opitutaceae bacterium]
MRMNDPVAVHLKRRTVVALTGLTHRLAVERSVETVDHRLLFRHERPVDHDATSDMPHATFPTPLDQPPRASRAVGTALGANPGPLLLPCNRVVAPNGKLTVSFCDSFVDTKARLRALVGAQLRSR